METLEVGMYVRTKELNDVIIVKVLEVIDDGFKADNNMFYMFSEVIKASHNIIDLIKNKDLCEIEFYSLRYNERVTRLFEVEIITDTYINFKNARCEFILINKQWNSEDLELKPIIKKVLTHEQFENNCYKIGDYL